MRLTRIHKRFLFSLLGAAALLAVSCNDGIGLLTTDEKQSLYRAEASSPGSSTIASFQTQGVILNPALGVKILFETVKGSEEPVDLSVTLKNASGASAASYLFLTDSSASKSPTGTVARSVPSLDSFSYTLALPADLPDGYYELYLDARSARSETLYQTDIALFLIRGVLPPPAILVYPANPTPGSRVLLVADLEGYEGRDPYLRWTVDGSVRAEGTVSEGKGTLLWPAPTAGSAAPVSLAVYPCAPPAGVAYSFPAPRSAATSLLVASSGAALADEFGEADRFLALFRMEDTPDYVGKAAGTGVFVGSPRLDAHAGGFGLTMGSVNSSGIRAGLVLLPIENGKLNPFSLLVRFVPDKNSTGTLFRTACDSSGPELEVSLTEGRPGLTVRFQGHSSELKADLFLQGGRSCVLGVSVLPEPSGLRVQFHADGRPCGSGELPYGNAGWTVSGSTLIAGPQGCPGLYDEVGVWAYDSNGSPAIFPAFLFDSRRKFGALLRIAEGFEGKYQTGWSLAGGASASALEGLRLPAGGKAAFDASVEDPFRVEVFLNSGNRVILSVAGSGETVYIPLDASSGRVDGDTGLSVVSVRTEQPAEGSKTGIRLAAGGRAPLDVKGAGPWRLELAGADSGTAVVRFFRVVRAEEPAVE